MRNILYDTQWGLELPKEVQIRRILRVMEQELTEKQRAYLYAYYFQEESPAQIARHFGVHRSTIQRTIARAEDRLRRHLTY
jgi:RNA polymerase sigma factor (sigma-70 family)